MQKIGDITDTADGNGEFTDGNVAGNVMPTELMAAWFTTIQREIIAVLTEAKIQPDKADDAQLLAAIKIILTKGIDGSGFLLAKNNFSDVEDKALSRGHLGLKSAAIQDVVTSMTDTTTGRVPVVGWMGLGGLTPALGTDNVTCFYYGGVGSPTNPLKDRGFAFVNLAVSGSYRCRLALDYTSGAPRIFYQNILNNTYNPYIEFYTTVNRPTANDVGALPLEGGTIGNLTVNNQIQVGGIGNGVLNIGDTDSGLRSSVDGQVDLYANGVMRGYWNTTIFSFTGQIIPTNYANFDAKYQAKGSYTPAGQAYTKTESDGRYMRDVRLGTQAKTGDGQFTLPAGCVVTSVWSVDWGVHALYYKPIQRNINGSWVTISG